MIVCQCNKKIEYFIAIAHNSYSPLNPRKNPVIISGGSFFVCQNCAQKKVDYWEKHNRGRIDPYKIGIAKVNVKANTKKDFIFRASPQLFSQFQRKSWWLSKSDIQSAIKYVKKNATP